MTTSGSSMPTTWSRVRPTSGPLTADVYELRYHDGGTMTYWRKQVFRDGLQWRYQGVVHEFPECPDPTHSERLDGDYHIESRRLGARNQDPEKYAKYCDLLLAELRGSPTMRGLRSIWPRATSISATSRTRARGTRGEPRWAGGKRRSSAPCTGSPSRCRISVPHGPMFRTRSARLGVPPRAIGIPSCDRLQVPPRRALPPRLSLRQARRRDPVPRRRHIVRRRGRLRLACHGRTRGVRIPPAEAHGGVRAVPATGSRTRHPRRGPEKDCSEP